MKNNKKPTKTEQVKAHLVKNGSITSWEAIQNYGATRLSAIIHVLRHKKKWNIESKDISEVDRNGNNCTFTKYVYHAPKY